MKLRIAILTLTLWAIGLIAPQTSQGNSQLNEQLQQAICGQNWYHAIQIIQRMKQIAPHEAGRLTAYQTRLQALADRNLRVPDWNCATGLPTATDSPDSQIFTVPIVARLGGIPVVAVTFNDKHTYNMLFDTGASITFILTSMAQEIDVSVTGRGFATVADGREIPTFYGQVNSLKLGDLTLKDVEVSFDANPSDEAELNGIGLLGQNVYGLYDVTIRENEIELRTR